MMLLRLLYRLGVLYPPEVRHSVDRDLEIRFEDRCYR
jgi:hypothetical protein